MTNAADDRGAGGWLAPPRHRHLSDVRNLCLDAERDHRHALCSVGQALMARETAAERPVADAMVTCPKTHGPRSGLEKIRAFFEDDHVHVALIVATDGRLVTTIERSDLAAATSSSAPAAKLATLIGRTAGPADPLGDRDPLAGQELGCGLFHGLHVTSFSLLFGLGISYLRPTPRGQGWRSGQRPVRGGRGPPSARSRVRRQLARPVATMRVRGRARLAGLGALDLQPLRSTGDFRLWSSRPSSNPPASARTRSRCGD